MSAQGVMAAAPLAEKHPRRADIQGLRAVAVLLVVAYHGHLPIPGGFIGVDVFFVISGFVITSMLARQLHSRGAFSFREFYTRRMRRLLPALALLTTVTTLAAGLLLSPLGPQQATARTAFAASLFVANIQLGTSGGGGYFDLTAETNAMLHTWSLSVEEQFYFLFPAILFLGWRMGRRRRATLLVLVLTLGSFAYSFYATHHDAGGVSAFYSPLARVWEFGVGSLLALSIPLLQRLDCRLGHGLGLGGALLVGIGAFAIDEQTPFPGSAALLPVVGTGLILAAGTVSDRGIAALLSVRLATRIGDLSYSWYLWHWPPIVFAAALWPGNTWVLAVTAVVTLAPAWLSFRFIEEPIRSNTRIVGRRAVGLVAACIVIPAVASVVLQGVSSWEQRLPAVRTIADAVRLHAPETSPDCQSFDVVRCTWTVDRPRGTILLVGDSNAAQFTEPLAAAANRAGYDLAVTAQPSCPFADLIAGGVHVENGQECHAFVSRLVQTIHTQPPAMVIVANSSSAYIENDGITLTDPATGVVATTPQTKAALWVPALAAVLEPLGVPTVVVHPIPHFGQWPWAWQPETCPALRMFTHSCQIAQISRGEVELQQRRARDAENQAIARVGGVTAIDLSDVLCAADACRTDRYIPWLYRDATHLSIQGSLTLTDRFLDVVTEHVR